MPGTVKLDGVSMRFVIHHQKARSFQDALVNFVHQRKGSTEEFWALRDVSFEVKPGETLGIIGENGSGKSTILKLITRILEPTSGRVAVNGKVSALIELGAGFHPDLTGRENIYLNGSILGFGRKEMDRRFDDIVAFAELERFIDTPVKHYSSGMYARLGFSVAISVDPDILIIDEVLSVGDESFQQKCTDRIEDFRRRGKTIIIVSHALPVIEQLCNQMIWLHQGAIRSSGDSTFVVRQYRLSGDNQPTLNGSSAGPSDLHESAVSNCAVLRVRTFNRSGHERDVFNVGDPLIVRVQYRSVQPAARFGLSLQLRRQDGVLIHASEQVSELPLPADAMGDGGFDLEIERLPVLAGCFNLGVRLRTADSPGSAQRSWEGRCDFTVDSGEGLAGVTPLDWRIATRIPEAVEIEEVGLVSLPVH